MALPEAVLDLRGLKCPMPALLARRALDRAVPGSHIEVLADDPMAYIDVPHMCAQERYEVVSLAREGSFARMILRKPMAAR
jgi:tRNA 2-thiouridine synthesizing protein A